MEGRAVVSLPGCHDSEDDREQGKAEQMYSLAHKANCTTLHGWNAQTRAIQETPHVTLRRMIARPLLTCIGLILTRPKLHLAT